MRGILKRTVRRWMGNSGRLQGGKIEEKALKLKMTGYRIEKRRLRPGLDVEQKEG